MHLAQIQHGTERKSTGKTAIEEVYTALHQLILNGDIAPGSRLRIEELRQRFEVGSSTVREALSRLLADNLVTTREQRGFHVAPVSLEDFREIADLRILLECQAVRESIGKGDDNWESRLVAAHHQLTKVETQMPEKWQEKEYVDLWETRNNEFHDALVSACSNNWLLKLRKLVFTHSYRYRCISVKKRNVPRDVRAEHQAIFDAAIARDTDAAVAILTDHISRSVSAVAGQLAATGEVV